MQKKLSHKELGKLVEKAKQGDKKAFEEIYLNTVSIQFYTALKHTHDEILAEDVVQELYLKLYSFLDKIENPNLLVAYLNKMNYTISMDLLKDSKKIISVDIQEMANDLVDPNSYFKQDFENEDIVSVALNQLEPNLKNVIMLRYVDKLKVKEIAKYLKVSDRTVFRLLAEAIKNLRLECDKIRRSSSSFIFILTPFSLKILGKIARNCMSENQIINSYDIVAKAIAYPTKDVANLANNYAGSLNKLSFQNRFFRNFAFSFLTTAGIGLSAFILMNSDFDIHPVNKVNPNENYQVFEIEPKLGSLINELTVIDENANRIYSSEFVPGEQIILYKNGLYTIEARSENGKIITKELIVESIDDKSPTIKILEYNEGYIQVILYDMESGIDINTLKVINLSSEDVPYQLISSNEQSVVITMQMTEPLEIIINDSVNNQSVGKLNLK
ncbi:RNA polymerase sigma factor [Anaerorhabdus furcosa]|uniref:RNA polymerase sigma factor, sigma-70 family n=1 Tax=Anaerorhabdus furcosa TaxID=118967 RepID=A0A1T4MQL8_9FIRM|nr:sigma-70 family RNA polymerase sigma factor [Anaerorhabdus furcosa]SJZ69084.1 RNA polymerase sigma factor, sigma-70 family [Anaerorhabdus furcosa]